MPSAPPEGLPGAWVSQAAAGSPYSFVASLCVVLVVYAVAVFFWPALRAFGMELATLALGNEPLLRRPQTRSSKSGYHTLPTPQKLPPRQGSKRPMLTASPHVPKSRTIVDASARSVSSMTDAIQWRQLRSTSKTSSVASLKDIEYGLPSSPSADSKPVPDAVCCEGNLCLSKAALATRANRLLFLFVLMLVIYYDLRVGVQLAHAALQQQGATPVVLVAGAAWVLLLAPLFGMHHALKHFIAVEDGMGSCAYQCVSWVGLPFGILLLDAVMVLECIGLGSMVLAVIGVCARNDVSTLMRRYIPARALMLALVQVIPQFLLHSIVFLKLAGATESELGQLSLSGSSIVPQCLVLLPNQCSPQLHI